MFSLSLSLVFCLSTFISSEIRPQICKSYSNLFHFRFDFMCDIKFKYLMMMAVLHNVYTYTHKRTCLLCGKVVKQKLL